MAASGEPSKFVAHAPDDGRSLMAILCLLLASGPSTVRRAVSGIVVIALKSHARWALAHVGQEVVERVGPSITHRDSPAAVAFVMRLLGVGTSLFHAGPNLVLGGTAARVLRNLLNVQASTATVLPARQVGNPGNALIAALTKANQSPLFTLLRPL